MRQRPARGLSLAEGFGLFSLNQSARRLVYVFSFEIIAVFCSTLLMMLIGGGTGGAALPLAASISLIALVWNYIFNTVFEFCERKWRVAERTLLVRAIHAVGFQSGFIFIVIPLLMAWFKISLYEAFMMEAALLVFFLFYTFVFTFIFDKLFTTSNGGVAQA